MNNLQDFEVVQIVKIENIGKGKWRVAFDTGISCLLYWSELQILYAKENEKIVQSELNAKEGTTLSQAQYTLLLYEILAKRAKKRVLYLLEKMDRTEYQIREKLKKNEYPDCCIDIAIDYAKQFHYLDDARYANTFVRYHMEKYSRTQLKQKLMEKGIARKIVEQAIETEYCSEEKLQIQMLLQKKNFTGQKPNTPEFRRIYQFLLRRGFRSSDILKEMNAL